jgi:hypothetical protein
LPLLHLFKLLLLLLHLVLHLHRGLTIVYRSVHTPSLCFDGIAAHWFNGTAGQWFNGTAAAQWFNGTAAAQCFNGTAAQWLKCTAAAQ